MRGGCQLLKNGIKSISSGCVDAFVGDTENNSSKSRDKKPDNWGGEYLESLASIQHLKESEHFFEHHVSTT